MAIITRYKYLLLVVILLIAAAGRIINIDAESLWVDEGFSYWTIRDGNDLLDVVFNDVHPPVYFVMLKGWSSLTGLSELALRYLSVLPSLLAVVMVYRVTWELLPSAPQSPSPSWRGGRLTVIPLLAALMMALADMENYIAQETRMYTWHVLWVTVSMWAFLRWIRIRPLTPKSPLPQGARGLENKTSNDIDQSSEHAKLDLNRDLSAGTGLLSLLRFGHPYHARFMQSVWVVASVLLLYTHYIGAAAIAVQGLFALLFLRGRLRWVALITLVGIGALFIPWLLVVVSNQTANVGTGFNVPSTLESLWAYRDEWFTGQWALLIGLAVLGLVMFIPRFGAEYGRGMPRPYKQGGRGAFLLLAWIVVPVAGAYTLNFVTPILIDYRLTQITPAVALLIAFGLGAFRGWTLAFLVSVIVVYGVVIDDTPRPRPPWREVGRMAAHYAQPGDLSLAHITPSGDWQVIYYYDRFMPDDVENVSLRQWQLERGYDDYLANLPLLLAQHDHVWLMHWSSDTSAFDLLRATGHVQTAVMSADWLGNALNTYRFDLLPDDSITTYANGMTLRDAEIYPDDLRVDLWWSAESPLDSDYTVSAFLLTAEGLLVAQVDSQPFDNRRPTTTWNAGEVVYDPRPLTLAEGIESLPAGTYSVAVKVYQWTPDGIRDQRTLDGDDFATVGEIVIVR